MEVAVALHAVPHHHRVVDRRGQLALGDPRGVLHRVARSAVHRGRAAQGVGVLDPVAVGAAVRGDDAGLGQDPGEVGCRGGDPRVRAQGRELGGEDAVGAEQRLDRQRRRHVGGAQQHPQVLEREHQHPEHPVGAVDQRQSLLGSQLDGIQAGRGQRVGRRHQLAGGVADRALPHQREGAVRERGQVARAAERAVLVDHGGDAVPQQRREQLGDLTPYAGVAGRQRGQAQQHQRTHHLALHLRTRPRGVRAHQRALQLRAHLGGDVAGRERPEPGRDAVRRGLGRRERLDDTAGPVDARQGLRAEDHRGAVAGHGDDVAEGDRSRRELDGRWRGGRQDGARGRAWWRGWVRHLVMVTHPCRSGPTGGQASAPRLTVLTL